ncbi:N-acyl-D-amino-acid deacylase family protein [Phytoactinopolyspora limicola]|uniref:N-acyl-D-amino-acid deacylase family protein n=1 Tax=Phytoactinopolyspora limicola TaxID=2715536 RepID=UPI00140A425D|nr:amidohydrolase family protein [Phytoactinopolyspora limicola]
MCDESEDTPRRPIERRRFLALPLAGAVVTAVGGHAWADRSARPSTADVDGTGSHIDIVVRGGMVVDGTGQDRVVADIGVDNGFITGIGDLSAVSASVEIDARGLVVAPGFIDLHSHAADGALPIAESSLRQGVTTEILHPDGGGILRIAERLSLEEQGLGINIGAYIGFNAVWGQTVGTEDRRATPEEIERMRWNVLSGLKNGAWGVSLGLEYSRAYFAQTDQVVDVVEVARDWRTNTGSHIRNEHSGVVDAVSEHFTIGENAGLLPVVTHHKIMNCCWGRSSTTLAILDDFNERGVYTAMDQYPYLAASTGLTWIAPRWVLEGGRSAYLQRFADPQLRPQIENEIHELVESKVGEAGNVYIHSIGQTLAQAAAGAWDDSPVSAGEAAMRIIEDHGNTASIFHFGHEDDLRRIMRHPLVAIASDGGASTSSSTHPRRYGTFPRVLGRYVRDAGVLSLEDAVRKMTYLPATILGMVDRGVIAPGMVADLAIFNPDTVIDRATFEQPRQYAEGVEHVIVNGRLALHDGVLTGARSGRALRREHNMISRPETGEASARVAVNGRLLPMETPDADGETFVADFTGGEVGQPPAGWTRHWRDGSWTIADDPRRLRMGSTSGRRALTWDDVGDVDGDVEMFGRVRARGHSTLFHLGILTSGEASSETSYFIRARVQEHDSTPNQLQVGRYLDGGYYTLDSATMPFPVQHDAWYRVVLRRAGNMLRGKMWPDSADEPLDWQVQVAPFDPEIMTLTGGVGPSHCCSGAVTDWSYLSVGTGGKRAPRMPGDAPADPEVWRHAQLAFSASRHGRDSDGRLVLNVPDRGISFRSTAIGMLQTADGWFSLTGRGNLADEPAERAFVMTVDQHDPMADGQTVVAITIEGGHVLRGRLSGGTVRIRR